jgi:hypothetical protein
MVTMKPFYAVLLTLLLSPAMPAQTSKAEKEAALRAQAIEDQIASLYDRIRDLDDDRKNAEMAANDAENRAAMADGASASPDPRVAAAARTTASAERQNAASIRARARAESDEILSIVRQIEELKYAESHDGAPPRDRKPSASSSNPLVGSWKLNVARSTFAGEAPRKETRDIDPEKGGIQIVDTTSYREGRAVRTEWVGKIDGKDYPMQGDPTRTISISRASDHFFNFKIKVNGHVTTTGQIVCSPDGQSETITGTEIDARGAQTPFTTFWDREP